MSSSHRPSPSNDHLGITREQPTVEISVAHTEQDDDDLNAPNNSANQSDNESNSEEDDDNHLVSEASSDEFELLPNEEEKDNDKQVDNDDDNDRKHSTTTNCTQSSSLNGEASTLLSVPFHNNSIAGATKDANANLNLNAHNVSITNNVEYSNVISSNSSDQLNGSKQVQVKEKENAQLLNAHAPPTTESEPNSQHPNARTAEARERKRQSRKRARRAAALRERVNTSVYVTGLPDDASVEEVAKHFAKCGLLLPDPMTGRARVKLYKRENGSLKGDALVTYAMRPSVENALTLLDDAPFRPPNLRLKVQEASFDHKGEKQQEENNNKKLKLEGVKKVRAKDLIADALAWNEEELEIGERRKGAPRIVILKNVFNPKDKNKEVDYKMVRDDMEEGCTECGDVEKVTVFERNEEGAVAVKFKTTEGVLKCIQVMNGRWYDGRQLGAALYDGKTDYRYKETEADREKRDHKWQEWLEGKEDAGR